MKFEDPLEISLVCTRLMASQRAEQAAGPLAGRLNLQSDSDHAVPRKILAKSFVYEMSNIFSSLSCAWKRTILFMQCRDPHRATMAHRHQHAELQLETLTHGVKVLTEGPLTMGLGLLF